MKTIRLLYPDHLSGGLDTYHFGANLMAHILPNNPNQPLIKVPIAPPDTQPHQIIDGIFAKDTVFAGIQSAHTILQNEAPDKIITIGGNCIVSLAPFDYLHQRYENIGILWIGAHPDISTPQNGYPNAHAMVLGALLGQANNPLSTLCKHTPFKADQVLYIGLQSILDYQAEFLTQAGVNYKIQTESFIEHQEIKDFLNRFDHILLHFDIDVLDQKYFHSTYFANPELTGDGSGAGKMTLDELSSLLQFIHQHSNVVGFTIAEYLPFDEYRLHQIFNQIPLFSE
ncbi:arginase family protein [Gallibacterium genomosp. 3]|uniref:Arginase n=1 Tax=Gallibacterium genomosp. 3 TaxID=505345 RepID=A0A1A7Q7A7_9PAST|nr:arginase family protein [Gallibacterium genomosp. 3]OBX09996.1 arginase [Gallibacterium genomosp. 3]